MNEYIAEFPQDTRIVLEQIREAIRRQVSQAEETISYGMPSFKLNGRYLIYFAAYKQHIGLYPVPNNNAGFEEDFAAYKTSGRGTIQFPLNKPMPLNLIKKILKFRVKENLKTTRVSSKAKK
ncbi:MAG TPA: DUF1801 domain-containing protein [Cyclobacteriaceae bacterium]|nr:DUF1801 domain-containing protein [Cyclobacteriaceae bacterium]